MMRKRQFTRQKLYFILTLVVFIRGNMNAFLKHSITLVSHQLRYVPVFYITRWREDMGFMFEWRLVQYLTRELSEQVRYCSREHKTHIIEQPCNVLFII